MLLCKVVIKTAQFKLKLKWLNNFPISNLLKIHLSILEFFHAYGQIERQKNDFYNRFSGL
jgi:hypothetical protein